MVKVSVVNTKASDRLMIWLHRQSVSLLKISIWSPFISSSSI